MSTTQITSEATRDAKTEPARYGPLTSLAWLHFINDGAANFLPGVLPAILVAQGRSPALAGTLMFVLLAGQGLQPVAGLVGRALGGRRLMWIGVVCALIGAGLVGFADSLAWLLVVLALIGLANACFHPQALAAARVYAGGRGHFGLAIMLLGGEIGRGLWPLVASAVVAWGSLSSLWVPALIALATIPLVQRILPAPRIRTGEWRVRLRGRWRATGRLLAYVVLRGLVVIGATAYLPILWQQLGGGLVVGAALVTTMLIVGLIGTLYGGHLADQIGRRPVLATAGVMMAVGLALIASGNMIALWAGAALTGIAAFATFPVTTLEGQDLFPENMPFGSAISLGLGNALGAGLVALIGLLTNVWAVATLFWLFAGVALVTALLGLMARHSPEGH
ncbi:MAG TPA: MFS transporter [Oleiagrimonas sp.]|nr:MFS transporter [Oleiagrimonas sp.]